MKQNKKKKKPKINSDRRGGKTKGNFDEEFWRKGTNHEPNNLKLQTNKKKTKKQAITKGGRGENWKI